jgi:anaerobic selenocysteine-containing dehydrogenase
MKVIVDNKMHDEDFLKQYTVGWEELLNDRLPQFPLDRVEQITGVPAKDIEKLAIEYASTRKSHINANYGLNRHDNSGSTCRNIYLLPAITGAWRDPKSGAGCSGRDVGWGLSRLGFAEAGAWGAFKVACHQHGSARPGAERFEHEAADQDDVRLQR